MTISLKKFAVAAIGGLSMLVAGTAVNAQDAAPEGAPPALPQGWFKVCTKQEDNDVCIVQNLQQAANGQLLTAVGLITVSGKVNRKLIQVSVPSARAIAPGILMQIDGGKGQKLDYAVCMPDKCIAEAPLTDGLIAALKKGNEVVFTSINFQRAPNPIKISLEGFGTSFDGAPVEQSKLEETQRALQEKTLKEAEAAQEAGRRPEGLRRRTRSKLRQNNIRKPEFTFRAFFVCRTRKLTHQTCRRRILMGNDRFRSVTTRSAASKIWVICGCLSGVPLSSGTRFCSETYATYSVSSFPRADDRTAAHG